MKSWRRRVKEIVVAAWKKYYAWGIYRYYSSHYKRLLKLHHISNVQAEGEEDYVRKWKVLSSKVEPYSYRFFSHFVGNTPNIIPENIGRSVIEGILNPRPYRAVYSDKNLFPEIIGKADVPRTLLCRIHGGGLLDGDYQYADKDISCYLEGVNSAILKPSVNTKSGAGIVRFTREGGSFVSPEKGITLTKDYLLSYHHDFCLQETIEQHEQMQRLCPTSVNTIRLCLYRSVVDEEPKITSGIVRIGKNGSVVDNIHAGGMRIGVDVRTGVLGKYVVDQYGRKSEVWNDIDYSRTNFVIPHWEGVLSFARYVGTRIHHHRLLALDIAIGKTGKPILLEYNIHSFSYAPYMCTGQEVFGAYTDEIIAYCKKEQGRRYD